MDLRQILLKLAHSGICLARGVAGTTTGVENRRPIQSSFTDYLSGDLLWAGPLLHIEGGERPLIRRDMAPAPKVLSMNEVNMSINPHSVNGDPGKREVGARTKVGAENGGDMHSTDGH